MQVIDLSGKSGATSKMATTIVEQPGNEVRHNRNKRPRSASAIRQSMSRIMLPFLSTVLVSRSVARI